VRIGLPPFAFSNLCDGASGEYDTRERERDSKHIAVAMWTLPEMRPCERDRYTSSCCIWWFVIVITSAVIVKSAARIRVLSWMLLIAQSSVVMLFYPRDATHVFATATCPFVCPSVTTGIVSSTAKAGSLNVHHLIAPWIHFLKRYDSSKNSQWVTPNGRAKWDWSRFLGDFRQKCRHISKTVHFRHQKNYYRMVIGNHMQTIEWCHFRCPWVTHDPDFNSVARVCQLQLGFLVTTVSK